MDEPIPPGHVAAIFCLILLALGIAGAVRAWPWSWETGLVVTAPLYVWIMHIPLHAEARYTMPVRPQLIIMAVLALLGLLDRFRLQPP